jgi:putative membrane protein
MNRWWGRWALLGTMAVTLGSAALAQGRPGASQQLPEQKTEHDKKRDPMTQQAAEGGRMMVADGIPAFLTQLHAVNQTEIALGELTRQKASTPAVQQYGEHMVQDHTKADQQLQQLAQQRGLQLGAMAEPSNDVQRRIQSATEATKSKLTVLQGSLYDQEYLASQVASHDQTIQLVTIARQQYPELAPMLDGLLPTLRQHRDHAYQLLGQVKPQAQASQQPPAQPPQRQGRPAPAGR